MQSLQPRITWLGHASFRIEGNHSVIYIDPWQLASSPPKADIILITHDHYDHCSPEDVKLIQDDNTIIVTIPQAAEVLSGTIRTVSPGETVTIGNNVIDTVPAYNTNKFRSPGVHFHPRNAHYVGFIIALDGTRLYHAGDSDVIPEMDSVESDIALLPVSGIYVMTAEEAVTATERIQPKMAIPMHIGRGIGTIADAHRFRELCPRYATVLPMEE